MIYQTFGHGGKKIYIYCLKYNDFIIKKSKFVFFFLFNKKAYFHYKYIYIYILGVLFGPPYRACRTKWQINKWYLKTYT